MSFPLAILVPCATVALTGDGAIVAALGSKLEGRGLGPPVPGCARTQVHVAARGDAIALELSAPGAEIRREVTTLEAAAAVVEMWARPELPPAPQLPEAPRLPAAPRSAGGLSPSLATAGDIGVDEAGLVWAGGSLRVTGTLGRLDVGVVARGSRASREARALRSGAGLLAGELLVAAALPVRAGPIELAPGLAVGAGATSVSRGAACGGCLLIEDGFARTSIDPRLDLQLRAGWPFSTRFAAELTLGCTWNPAGGGAIVPAYARSLGEDRRDAVSLPGPPLLVARAGLGIRVLP